MKNILLIALSFFFCLNSFAQLDNRILIKGKINVELEDSAKDINVFNLNTTKGTVTDDYGEFLISVQKGDKLYFSGIQYQDFTVIVSQDVVDNRKMNININEAINELDEVTISSYDLSGNIEVDVTKMKTIDANYVKEDSRTLIAANNYELRPDKNTKVENDAIDKSYLTNGLNFANIFREIFLNGKNDDTEVNKEKIDVQVRKMYDNDFFKDYLDIEEENINRFIYYTEDHGLHEEMLKKGNELALIEFLRKKSEAFKMQQN